MNYAPDVTVLLTTIPPRHLMRARALGSVGYQELLPGQLVIQRDDDQRGAAENRNAGLERVTTPWVAFLDDDDEFLPHHLKALVEHQHDCGADVVYPWFEVVGGTDPLGWFGFDFDPVAMRSQNYVPVPVLARTELLRSVGGFRPPAWASPDNPCEDWGCWLACLDAGATFEHLARVTWRWHHHGQNTSGRLWTDPQLEARGVGR